MQKILHNLFYGNIIPWERRNPYSEERLKIVKKIEEEEQYFTEKMSLDDCKRFQAFTNLQSELLSAGEENIFSYGFTLGLLLMLDVADVAELIAGE